MTGHVVIVDDSLTVRMDLAEAFEEAGFRTLLCTTVAEARTTLLRDDVGVVVLDVVLPDGDGVDLLREIRCTASGTTLPIIMLSTEAEVGDRIRALKTGADEYVGKPYDRGYVVSRTRELLRARGPSAAVRLPSVLVIDDSATFRWALREHLVREGYEVLTADSGEEGLRIAADHRPHAIIVDGVLPGMDGASVIRHVRLDAALRGVPCLLLTASEDRNAELRALDAGADAFVRKGEDSDVILARLAAALRNTAPSASADAVSSLGPRKVLAVDDSPTYLSELAEMLQGEGYDVVLARSGEEALELLAVEPVDCILLDIVMPGLGGTETCRRIKAAPVVRDIPLVMLTGRDDRAALLDSLAAGADDFIAKSGDLPVLKARIRAQLRRKQFEDETRNIREQLLRKELEAVEARAARQLAETRAALVGELELKNQELEAFSFSVSHDLRAPLRAIDGFTVALAEDYGAALDAQGHDYIRRVRSAVRRMSELIEDLTKLAQVGRTEIEKRRIDITALASTVAAQLREREPARTVDVRIERELVLEGDQGLVRSLLENLLSNAWKFTSRSKDAVIEIGAIERDGRRGVYVRDNGVGFDPSRADKLFRPFLRLHAAAEFEGTGVGLATVQRIVVRHGGQVWAEGSVGGGALIGFTL
ncbi:MAG: arcB [Myxococcales bacterium]|nr:arcB [Myxococcales bacterium]